MTFSELFTYKADSKERSAASTKKVLRSLYKGVKIRWIAIIIGAILSILSSLIIFAVYDEYTAIFYGTLDSLAPLWKYLLVSFIQYIVIFASIIGDLALVGVVTGVRRKMWKKMMKLPLKDFDEAEPNSMLSRITSDAEYASQPFTVVIVILQLLFSANTLLAVRPTGLPEAAPFALISLLLAIAIIIFSIRIASRSATYLQERISMLTDHYSEQISNIRFIKASNSEEKAIEKTDQLIDDRYKAALYNAFGNALNALAGRSIWIIAYASCCLGGIMAIRHHTIDSTGPIQEVYGYMTAMEVGITYLLSIPTIFAAALGGSKKLASLLQGKEEDTEAGKEMDRSGDIVLSDASFSYGNDKTIDSLSVVIPANKVTAIVGYNGSGKSTLVKLIDRLYPLNEGELKLGEGNASETSLRSWRNRFAIVSQNARLFSGSIRENICYGMNEVKEEKLNAAVKAAGLEDLVKEKGLDYEVGVKGSRLSGGERQRVCIARALLKDPQYLILDEATANLDTKTETEVKAGLNQLMKGRTVLEIAHNYSALQDADYILVMNEGKLSDFGTKEEIEERDPFVEAMKRVI
ncbi:MAG: ABC transporter ATP-binding protein/permease [Erysipelotrichaceae bacterium]|nr:ABC transporter ATP-binding protein/permease [Erysipelotrichaceae bacterium]